MKNYWLVRVRTQESEVSKLKIILFVSLLCVSSTGYSSAMNTAKDIVAKSHELNELAVESLMRTQIIKLWESNFDEVVLSKMKLEKAAGLQKHLLAFENGIEGLDKKTIEVLNAEIDIAALDKIYLDEIERNLRALNEELMKLGREVTFLETDQVEDTANVLRFRNHLRTSLEDFSNKCKAGMGVDINTVDELDFRFTKSEIYEEFSGELKEIKNREKIRKGFAYANSSGSFAVAAAALSHTDSIKESGKVSDAYEYIFANKASFYTAMEIFKKKCDVFSLDLGNLLAGMQMGSSWIAPNLNENTVNNFLVLENQKSEVLAFVGVSLESKDRLWFGRFYVPREFRGQAYGKILLNELIRLANSKSKNLSLLVHEDNFKAKHLYKSYGFQKEAKVVILNKR